MFTSDISDCIWAAYTYAQVKCGSIAREACCHGNGYSNCDLLYLVYGVGIVWNSYYTPRQETYGK